MLEILTAIWYAKGGDGRHRPVAGDGDHILWTDTAQEDLNRDVVRMLFRAAGNSDSKVGLAVEAPA